MSWLGALLRIILILNAISAIYVVFHRHRSVGTTWAWLLVLLVFPVIGFIIYGFFGRGLSEENLFAINRQKHVGLRNVQKMIPKTPKLAGKSDTSKKADVVIDYFNENHDAPVSKNNKISIYTDGSDQFLHIFEDIENAKETINIEYYSFMNDNIGNQFLDLLIKKAKLGIKIRLLYDPWGSPGAKMSWFQPLIDEGGQVLPFITSRNMITKYRLNYHLHRKVIVIDGRISWTGGFNVGDQYLGRKKRFGYWRDTQVRIVGSASLLLQERFIMDWNASITDSNQLVTFDHRLFPYLDEDSLTSDDVATQIVSDGPDRYLPYMRNGMIRLMMLARKRLWIQTPYLIPDEPMLATWEIIVNSGVDVRIMIPSKPDHPFIYRATQWYANELTKLGVKIYSYENGFLHAKTIIVDDNFATIGSMNQDYRSYSLNFEANAVFYDSKVTKEMEKIFLEDIEQCHLVTIQDIQNQSRYIKALQRFSRLLSPIL